jgi:hypothetical protein
MAILAIQVAMAAVLTLQAAAGCEWKGMPGGMPCTFWQHSASRIVCTGPCPQWESRPIPAWVQVRWVGAASGCVGLRRVGSAKFSRPKSRVLGPDQVGSERRVGSWPSQVESGPSVGQCAKVQGGRFWPFKWRWRPCSLCRRHRSPVGSACRAAGSVRSASCVDCIPILPAPIVVCVTFGHVGWLRRAVESGRSNQGKARGSTPLGRARSRRVEPRQVGPDRARMCAISLRLPGTSQGAAGAAAGAAVGAPYCTSSKVQVVAAP